MNRDPKASQRITRREPLEAILRRIDTLAPPVKPHDAATVAAAGRVLAADVPAAAPLPAYAVALHDGWAIAADAVADAGPYAPVALDAAWVEAGDAMPPGADAVLAEDAATPAGHGIEALAPVAPGEAMLPAGGDVAADAQLGRAGEQLRALDAALLQAAGIDSVSIRLPQIGLLRANAEALQGRDVVTPLIAGMLDASGGAARVMAGSLEAALDDERMDALIVVGGSGTGRRDRSVTTLARLGRVEMHGFGIRPGETAALGSVGPRPVLVVPGRFDAALAVFLVAGLRLVARLAGRTRYIPTTPVRLARKVASPVGIADFVPLERLSKSEAAPLAAEPVPLQALARADGWLLVPAESEGYPEASEVDMRLFP